MKRMVFFGMIICCANALAQTTISSVYVQSSTATTATIVWTTSTSATSQIKYGYDNTLPFANSPDYNNVTSHSMTLTFLNASRPYYFATVSVDSGGHITQSSTYQFALCGQPYVPVNGTVNQFYYSGTYSISWNPPSGSSGAPTVCGQPLTTTVTGNLNLSGSFSAQVADALKVTPGPGTWTVGVADIGDISPISVTLPLSSDTQDISAQLQAAAAATSLVGVIANNNNDTVYPSWIGGAFFPGVTSCGTGCLDATGTVNSAGGTMTGTITADGNQNNSSTVAIKSVSVPNVSVAASTVGTFPNLPAGSTLTPVSTNWVDLGCTVVNQGTVGGDALLPLQLSAATLTPPLDYTGLIYVVLFADTSGNSACTSGPTTTPLTSATIGVAEAGTIGNLQAGTYANVLPSTASYTMYPELQYAMPVGIVTTGGAPNYVCATTTCSWHVAIYMPSLPVGANVEFNSVTCTGQGYTSNGTAGVPTGWSAATGVCGSYWLRGADAPLIEGRVTQQTSWLANVNQATVNLYNLNNNTLAMNYSGAGYAIQANTKNGAGLSTQSTYGSYNVVLANMWGGNLYGSQSGTLTANASSYGLDLFRDYLGGTYWNTQPQLQLTDETPYPTTSSAPAQFQINFSGATGGSHVAFAPNPGLATNSSLSSFQFIQENSTSATACNMHFGVGFSSTAWYFCANPSGVQVPAVYLVNSGFRAGDLLSVGANTTCNSVTCNVLADSGIASAPSVYSYTTLVAGCSGTLANGATVTLANLGQWGTLGCSSTSATNQINLGYAGTIYNLACNAFPQSGQAVGGETIQIWKNGSAVSGATCVIPAGSTNTVSGTSTPLSLSFLATDYLMLRVVANGSGEEAGDVTAALSISNGGPTSFSVNGTLVTPTGGNVNLISGAGIALTPAAGQITVTAIPNTEPGYALCETSSHTIGHCSTAVGSSGTCTCN